LLTFILEHLAYLSTVGLLYKLLFPHTEQYKNSYNNQCFTLLALLLLYTQ